MTTNDASELLYPPGAVVASRSVEDARSAAFDRLRLFVSLLRFFRRGDKGGAPAEFRVPLANVLEEWPDEEVELKLPSVAFLASPGVHEAVALGPPIFCEESVDVFGKGTALEQTGLYREVLGVEAWGHRKAERRALIAGLKGAFTSASESYAIRMKLPAYYDQIATFMLDESQYTDDPDVVRGRRRGTLRVTMTVPEVRLIAYRPLRVFVGVEVVDRGACAGDVVFETQVV